MPKTYAKLMEAYKKKRWKQPKAGQEYAKPSLGEKVLYKAGQAQTGYRRLKRRVKRALKPATSKTPGTTTRTKAVIGGVKATGVDYEKDKPSKRLSRRRSR